ncbi:MAG: thioredoxin-disulfide reductase [Actinomycetia bacterium]|nr:thioredoxin-disulfide reductase [Actinomycetes bacterium]
MSDLIDVAIIGGGPAGTTAALYAARGKARTVIFERSMMGGQIVTTDHVDNYPGFPEGISGPELGELMHQQALAHGAEIMQFVDITNLKHLDDGTFELTADDETYTARAVVLASGSVPSKLGIPGEEEFTGRGVSWCATCDAAFYKEKDVAVIGGGDAAVEEAIYLTKFAKKVYLIHRRDEFRAAATLVDKVRETSGIEIITPYNPVEIKGEDGKVSGLVIESADDKSTRELAVSGVFEFVGANPQNVLAYDLLERDERGYIITGNDGSTKVPGLFCAGDITQVPLKQIVTAAASGAIAGFYAVAYVDKKD